MTVALITHSQVEEDLLNETRFRLLSWRPFVLLCKVNRSRPGNIWNRYFYWHSSWAFGVEIKSDSREHRSISRVINYQIMTIHVELIMRRTLTWCASRYTGWRNDKSRFNLKRVKDFLIKSFRRGSIYITRKTFTHKDQPWKSNFNWKTINFHRKN